LDQIRERVLLGRDRRGLSHSFAGARGIEKTHTLRAQSALAEE
jgi:hypothetical protein